MTKVQKLYAHVIEDPMIIIMSMTNTALRLPMDARSPPHIAPIKAPAGTIVVTIELNVVLSSIKLMPFSSYWIKIKSKKLLNEVIPCPNWKKPKLIAKVHADRYLMLIVFAIFTKDESCIIVFIIITINGQKT